MFAEYAPGKDHGLAKAGLKIRVVGAGMVCDIVTP
jgi:hypothetical protein